MTDKNMSMFINALNLRCVWFRLKHQTRIPTTTRARTTATAIIHPVLDSEIEENTPM